MIDDALIPYIARPSAVTALQMFDRESLIFREQL